MGLSLHFLEIVNAAVILVRISMIDRTNYSLDPGGLQSKSVEI